nr:MAG TPA: hypothetical protein [Caudoviricetes sp.]
MRSIIKIQGINFITYVNVNVENRRLFDILILKRRKLYHVASAINHRKS